MNRKIILQFLLSKNEQLTITLKTIIFKQNAMIFLVYFRMTIQKKIHYRLMIKKIPY